MIAGLGVGKIAFLYNKPEVAKHQDFSLRNQVTEKQEAAGTQLFNMEKGIPVVFL